MVSRTFASVTSRPLIDAVHRQAGPTYFSLILTVTRCILSLTSLPSFPADHQSKAVDPITDDAVKRSTTVLCSEASTVHDIFANSFHSMRAQQGGSQQPGILQPSNVLTPRPGRNDYGHHSPVSHCQDSRGLPRRGYGRGQSTHCTAAWRWPVKQGLA